MLCFQAWQPAEKHARLAPQTTPNNARTCTLLLEEVRQLLPGVNQLSIILISMLLLPLKPAAAAVASAAVSAVSVAAATAALLLLIVVLPTATTCSNTLDSDNQT